MEDSTVVTERRGTVLLIELNRPATRNAIDLLTAELLAAAMTRLDSDPALSIGVLCGRDGAFSSGMDLKAFLTGERSEIPGRGFGGLVEAPPQKPLIAAVEGYALAGGFELALACDLIVAAEDASFGIPEVSRGLVASGGGLIRLPRRIPYHLAMELALTGRRLPAREAHELGVVNRLVEPGAAVEAAIALAAEIDQNGPLAVRASKRILGEASDRTEAEAFAAQRPIAERVTASEDAREGSRAFAEKRPPHWQGR